MADLKTKRNDASVDDFLNSIKDEQVRQDCWTIVDIMRKATKAKPQMWGSSIVGFGNRRYKYASGREIDWMLAAFSPRKQNITLYISSGFEGYDELMSQLGKHSCSKACIYIKRLSDVHLPTLKKLISGSVKHALKTNKSDERH
ncbi:MAG TPA: DUF1801 domain-containing protein [Blastocatellia bacterium]|jgi:hypothetical protein|nr:DUF1801 domain-containing protein [Blastocatellia bacterium]